MREVGKYGVESCEDQNKYNFFSVQSKLKMVFVSIHLIDCMKFYRRRGKMLETWMRRAVGNENSERCETNEAMGREMGEKV